MNHSSLEQLAGDEFLIDYGVIGGPRALHSALQRSAQVQTLREAIATSQVSEEDIRDFVASLLRNLQPDKLFPYDVTLAAIAVALERRGTAFSEEFITDLARLRRVEAPMAPRIARESARVQASVPSSKAGVCSLLPASDVPEQWEAAPRFVDPLPGEFEDCIWYGGG